MKAANIFTLSSTAVFLVCVCLRVCVPGRGVVGHGHSSGRALGKLQDVHLAAGHRAHYHSRTWSHQKDWGKGKHSVEVPLSAGLQAHPQTHAQKAACKHTHGHPSTKLSVAAPLPSPDWDMLMQQRHERATWFRSTLLQWINMGATAGSILHLPDLCICKLIKKEGKKKTQPNLSLRGSCPKASGVEQWQKCWEKGEKCSQNGEKSADESPHAGASYIRRTRADLPATPR